MDKCAIEILQLIFGLLPQSQIATCSLVCRLWYFAARKSLYHSVHFYSLDRVLAFIDLTPSSTIDENDTAIIRYIKLTPRGHLIRKMTFHIQIKESSTWSALQTISPRVTAVDIFPENDHGLYGICCHRHRYPLALQWKELERLPVWHKDDYGLWMPLLSDQLIYLGLDVYFYDHLIATDSPEKSTSFLSSIILQGNGQLVTKRLHLPPMRCLQELDLYASRHFFLIDERSLELIHAACPNLRKFSLTFFQMHIVTAPNDPTYLPANLSSLLLDRCCIHDLLTYSYLGHKYPNLKSLKVKEIRKGPYNHHIDAGDHRSAIFSLITKHFTQLTNISADMYEPLDNDFRPSPSESIWPYSDLRQWLSNHSKAKTSPIKKLHWSCLLPVDPLMDNDEKNTSSPEQILPVFEFPNRFYFSQLTSLSMILPSNATDLQVQQLWESQRNSTPMLPLLKTLVIRHASGNHHTVNNNGTSFPRRKNQDFYALANACPNLVRLEIENGLFLPENNWQHKKVLLHSLKKLAISNCLVLSLKKNVADVVSQNCPNLTHLSLNNVQCQPPPPSPSPSPSTPSSSSNDCYFLPAKESGYSFILLINIPLHSLDYLVLSNLWYERMMTSDRRYTKRVAVNAIKINQDGVALNQASIESQRPLSLNDTDGEHSTMTQVSVLVNCQYVAQSSINLGKYM